MIKAPALLAALLGLAACGAERPFPEMELGERARVVRVIDGDLLTLDGGQVVRLAGVEAPHLGRRGGAPDPYAEAARDALTGLALGRDVQLYYPGLTRDRYDRAIAHLLSRDGRGAPVWLNQAVIHLGAARVRLYPDTDAAAHLLFEAENEARRAGRGLWALRAYQSKRAQAVDLAGNGFLLVRLAFGPTLPDQGDVPGRIACRRAVQDAALVVRIMAVAGDFCSVPAFLPYEVRGQLRGGELVLAHPLHAVPIPGL